MFRIRRKPVNSQVQRVEDYISGILRLPARRPDIWRREIRSIPLDQGEIAVAVIHNIRWIEWQIFSAFVMRKRGYRPVLIYSNSELRRIIDAANFRERSIEAFHPECVSIPDAKLIDLDTLFDVGFVPDASMRALVLRLSHMGAAYSLGVEEFEEESHPAYPSRRLEMEKDILQYVPATEMALRQTSAETLVCPNGRFGLSIPMRIAAERLARRAVFVEGWGMRPGHMLIGVNRPAMDWDIEGWRQAIGTWDRSLEEDYQAYIRFRQGHSVRQQGWFRTFHQTQRVPMGQGLPEKVVRVLSRPGQTSLLGTNCVGDSSTLGKATVFQSQKAMLEQLVPFFASHSELNLIIRIHPDEVVWPTNQPLDPIARKLADRAPNILVVGPLEKINSFDLMKASDMGLAWVSNFGLEMALIGKPVILCAAAPYAKLGLCYTPSSPDETLALIDQLNRNPEFPPGYADACNSGKAYLLTLFNYMSMRAFGRKYRVTELRLSDDQPERERYFDILTGTRNLFQ